MPYAGFVTPLSDGRKVPIDLFVSDPSVDRYDRDQYEAGYTFETKLGDDLHFVSNGRYAEIDLTYAGLFGQFTGNPVLAGGRYYLTGVITRQLAAWAAILAVPTAIAGIYGMNFEHMPELRSPYGYPITLGVILTICSGLYWRFRRTRWL